MNVAFLRDPSAGGGHVWLPRRDAWRDVTAVLLTSDAPVEEAASKNRHPPTPKMYTSDLGPVERGGECEPHLIRSRLAHAFKHNPRHLLGIRLAQIS